MRDIAAVRADIEKLRAELSELERLAERHHDLEKHAHEMLASLAHGVNNRGAILMEYTANPPTNQKGYWDLSRSVSYKLRFESQRLGRVEMTIEKDVKR